MSRPRYTPSDEDRRKVKLLAGFGLKEEQIASLFINPQTNKPIAVKTLRARFRKEIDSGEATLISQVAQSLFRKAIGNGSQSVTAAIFWLKVRAGWRTVERTELTGADGQPIEIVDDSDGVLSKLLPEAAEEGARAAIEKARAE